MKIIVDDKIPFIRGVFEPFAQVEYVNGAAISPLHVRHADALVVRTRTPCNATLLKDSSVRFIASATIGYDHIDADFCRARGVSWTNAAGCNSGAVEQYITAVLLELAHRHGIKLSEKTLGVIGVGNVGKRIVRVAQALGMHVLQNDPPREKAEGSTSFVPIHELAAQSDFISIHVPLQHSGTDKTFHLINEDFLSLLKPKAYLINSSRGEVVDEAALKKALQQNRLSGIALDVWEHEPDIDTELLSIAEIGTPHIAGYSAEGKAMATQMAVQAVATFFDLPPKAWLCETSPTFDGQDVAADCKGKSLQEVLWELVRHTYPILLDDAALRQSPASGEELRSSYRYRREFSAYRVSLHQADEKQKAAIAQVFPRID